LTRPIYHQEIESYVMLQTIQNMYIPNLAGEQPDATKVLLYLPRICYVFGGVAASRDTQPTT
jgi:hypothetical protein